MKSAHIVILGPTCSGKSACAVELAHRIDAEVISCDSMQIYRGLEIGTAQPSMEERAGIPHHLIGERDIHEPYDVNRFLEQCKGHLRRLEAAGKRAVIVGGTGLYAKALVYGHVLPPSEPALAERIRRINETPEGHSALMEELEKAAGGPAAIPRDLVLNPRHFTRACEVFRLTGMLPWQLNPPNAVPSDEFRQVILLPDFGELKERIRFRTRRMLEAGWVDEARRACEAGLLESPTARQALGYKDIHAYLESGKEDPEGLWTVLSNRTIQYARRQIGRASCRERVLPTV